MVQTDQISARFHVHKCWRKKTMRERIRQISRLKFFSSQLRYTIFLAFCLISVLSWPVVASAATYYVDPATGVNTNNGTDPTTPWRNPPGTRTTNNNGFISSAWGSISTTNKIKCGDTLLLKGGSTQTSAQGGGWRIDDGNSEDGTGYYTRNCPTTSPITIRVATVAEWSGSSGHFTLAGTGIIPPCLRFCGSGGRGGLVHIQDVDTFVLGGNSTSQRLIIRDSNEDGIVVTASSGSTTFRFKGQFLELTANGSTGIELGGTVDTWIVADTLSHSNWGSGFGTGLSVDHRTRNGAFVRTDAYNNGLGQTDPNTGCASTGDAYLFSGMSSLWVINSRAYDNNCLAFNAGAIWNPNVQSSGTDWNIRVRDFQAWDNGRTVSNGSGRSGFASSGDQDTTGYSVNVYLNRGIFYRHPGRGGIWFPHDSGKMFVWHSVVYNNGFTRGSDLTYERNANASEIYNSIMVQGASSPNIWGYNTAGQAFDFRPVSDHNLYDFANSGNDSFSGFRFSGNTFLASGVTFNNATAQSGFSGPNDLISTSSRRYNPAFTSTGGNCNTGAFVYEDCDFTLRASSDAIDAGRFFMRATSGGTNANTMQVDTDPRNFFIAPDSFLNAPADTIQIEGAGTVTIVSMTQNSITFTPATSWANGAGVHLPWTGSRPDIGAYEFSSDVSPLLPPENLRLIP